MKEESSAQVSKEAAKGTKELVCQKYGEAVPMRDDMACLHPKEVCKFRLTCPIHLIGQQNK